MGKFLLVVVAIAVGYSIGFRDARNNPENILVRAVGQVREIFGGKTLNDVDAVMTKIEGKN